MLDKPIAVRKLAVKVYLSLVSQSKNHINIEIISDSVDVPLGDAKDILGSSSSSSQDGSGLSSSREFEGGRQPADAKSIDQSMDHLLQGNIQKSNELSAASGEGYSSKLSFSGQDKQASKLKRKQSELLSVSMSGGIDNSVSSRMKNAVFGGLFEKKKSSIAEDECHHIA